jgi:hypothetical protein
MVKEDKEITPEVDFSTIKAPAIEIENFLGSEYDEVDHDYNDHLLTSDLDELGDSGVQTPERNESNQSDCEDYDRYDDQKSSKVKERGKRIIHNGSEDEEEEGEVDDSQQEWEDKASIDSLGFKRERSVSPDQRSVRSKSSQREERGYMTHSHEEQECREAEIANMAVTADEIACISFKALNDGNRIANEDPFSTDKKRRIVKLFKIWREAKGDMFRKRLNLVARHSLVPSWEQFTLYVVEGEERIWTEIIKRRSNNQKKSLSVLRELVHKSCRDTRLPCVVYLREEQCNYCYNEGREKPAGDFDHREIGDDYHEEQIRLYKKALRERDNRVTREAIVEKSSTHHTREQRQEYPARAVHEGSKSHDRKNIRSNERGKRESFSPSASNDEGFEYGGYESHRSDRAYPSAYEERTRRDPGDRRSPQQSSVPARGYPSRGVDPGDYARSADWNYQSLTAMLTSQQNQLSVGLSHAAEHRGKLDVKQQQADIQHAKMSGDIDKLKRVTYSLQKEVTQLREMLTRLLRQRQNVVSTKEPKE